LNDEKRGLAVLFKELATLKTDAPLFEDVDELQWRGATPEFEAVTKKIENPRLLMKVRKLEGSLS
jgi:hypothetical protein